jgi:hypothetical protein
MINKVLSRKITQITELHESWSSVTSNIDNYYFYTSVFFFVDFIAENLPGELFVEMQSFLNVHFHPLQRFRFIMWCTHSVYLIMEYEYVDNLVTKE